MHTDCWRFFQRVKHQYPEYFENCKVLDVGSIDYSGTLRFLFNNCNYIGLDIEPGKDVDIVCLAKDYNVPDGSFDTIVSAEVFEHDKTYKDSLSNIVRMLKSNGLFAFTCASDPRKPHCHDGKMFKASFNIWGSYYKNLNENDIREVLDIEDIFKEFKFETINTAEVASKSDLRFWGIKK